MRRAFALIHEHLQLLDQHIRQAGGTLVKTVDAGVLAVFNNALAAVTVACELQELLRKHEATRELGLRIAVHRGSALVATLNDHLDYFGTTVNRATQLPRSALRDQVIVTESVTADPYVAAWLRHRRFPDEIVEALEGVVHRLTVGVR